MSSQSEKKSLELQRSYLLGLLKNRSDGVDRSGIEKELTRIATKLELLELVRPGMEHFEAEAEAEKVPPQIINPAPTTPAKEVESIDEQRLIYDFIYFAEHFEIKYRPGLNPNFPTGGRGKLRMTPDQKKLIALIIHLAFVKKVPVRLMILKSRQLGCTTILELFKLWLTLTHPNFVSFFIIDKDAHLMTKREVMLDWIKQARDLSPRFATIARGGKKPKALFFTNKSIMLMDSSLSPSPGTSENLGWLSTSEETKWTTSRPEQVKASLFPGIAEVQMTFIVRESTAEGVGAFYRDWLTAKKGGIFIPVFIAWFTSPECNKTPPPGFSADYENGEYSDWDFENEVEIPEREYQIKYGLTDSQIYWRRSKIDTFQGNRAMFDQEYPTTDEHAFRLFQSGFFSRSTLDQVESSIEKPVFTGNIADSGSVTIQGDPVHFSLLKPILQKDPSGPLQIWEFPRSGERYFAAVDCAEGIVTETTDGEHDPDYTDITFVGSDGRTVAKYRSRERPEEIWLPYTLLGIMYNLATLHGEIQASGPLLYLMIRIAYPNLLVLREPSNRPIRDRTWIRTNPANRKIFLQDLRSIWRSNPEFVRCELTFGEMVSFVVDKNGKPKAASGFHDDSIMSHAHAEFCRRFELGLSYTIESEPDKPEEVIKIVYPEDGITILDTDDPWIAELLYSH